MRLKEKEIEYTAWRILRKLKDKDEILFLTATEHEVLEFLKTVITRELKVEDFLNRVVEKKIRLHENEIQMGALDARKIFRDAKREYSKLRKSDIIRLLLDELDEGVTDDDRKDLQKMLREEEAFSG